ncbi:hypothetical protein Mal15_59870 [Stieleria maiorica]|uniref:Prenyltransferase and squalene oxidase repeat protein n=1 Tax=Stieleria maiorica TaxID=2795974 RepID=A0A5B9MQ89_9BACT|nr:hypothetical protein [Stieleria maiorica]QEG01906.1 hypothetical protein Mal15_59870 [Stieleria maiorica]
MTGCEKSSEQTASIERHAQAHPVDHPAAQLPRQSGAPVDVPVRWHLHPRQIDIQKYRSVLERCSIDENGTIPDLLHLAPLCRDRNEVAFGNFIQALLHHSRYLTFFPRASVNSPPYLIATGYGARFSDRTWSPSDQEMNTREAHAGQTLAVLSNIGLDTSTPITTSTGPMTLQDVVNDSIATFSMQEEPYWVVHALAAYLPPAKSWTNQFGEVFTFDQIANHLMVAKNGRQYSGPCGGTHALQLLTTLLAVDEQSDILAPTTTVEIRHFLGTASRLLERSQDSDGAWHPNWSGDGAGASRYAEPEAHGVWITGHHLEWQVRVEKELRVNDKQLADAARYVVEYLDTIPDSLLNSEPCLLTHGINAIRVALEIEDDAT